MGVGCEIGFRPRPDVRQCCIHGLWRSLAARLLWEQEVAGSNPASPTEGRVTVGNLVRLADVAQW